MWNITSQIAILCRLHCQFMFNHSTLTTLWIWILLTKYNATKAYLTITDLNLCHVCKTAHGASRTYIVLVGSRSCSRRIVCLFKRDLHYFFSFFNNDFLPNVIFYLFFRPRLSLQMYHQIRRYDRLDHCRGNCCTVQIHRT